jgi:hypothetical protein
VTEASACQEDEVQSSFQAPPAQSGVKVIAMIRKTGGVSGCGTPPGT